MTIYLLWNLPLLVLLVLAAGWDLRERRIPNWITLLLIVSGFARCCILRGTPGPGTAALGMLAGAAIPFALFAIGALGAGDVKLMAGVGAWVGPVPALAVFLIAGVVGMVVVLAQAGLQGRTALLFRNSAVVALNLIYVRQVGLKHATDTGRSTRSVDRPLPYAVPVLAAFLLLSAQKLTR
jgi:prepilin peptidase CpaA